MPGPAYLVTNDLEAALGITASSEESLFPLGNLRDEIAANPFKWSEDVSGGVTLFIEVDFGAVTSGIDTIVLVNHNFPQSTKFSLKSGASAAPVAELATLTWREFDIWEKFTAPTHQFWRLEITIKAGATTAVMLLGELYFGTRKELLARRSFGFFEGRMHKDITMQTRRGVRKPFGLYDALNFNVRFRSVRDNQIADLDALDVATNGSRTPLIWIPDTGLSDVFNVRLMGDYRELSVEMNEWDVELNFEEESRGDVIEPIPDSA